ncbi:MAG: WhiB family transcriptional regulator, redox-sensing transcriptional regulator [Frankiaceae bacterium]|nr:WhiB family transcriptional regulator, redox-sensing transcriptional regulator [Frankiaceae bacterium]
MEWSDRAACLTAEPDTFFPVSSTGVALDDVAVAKTICRACAVVDSCRDYALSSRQPFGVWGGLDEGERRAIWAKSPTPALVT